jgi:hypothetical protein
MGKLDRIRGVSEAEPRGEILSEAKDLDERPEAAKFFSSGSRLREYGRCRFTPLLLSTLVLSSE